MQLNHGQVLIYISSNLYIGSVTQQINSYLKKAIILMYTEFRMNNC